MSYHKNCAIAFLTETLHHLKQQAHGEGTSSPGEDSEMGQRLTHAPPEEQSQQTSTTLTTDETQKAQEIQHEKEKLKQENMRLQKILEDMQASFGQQRNEYDKLMQENSRLQKRVSCFFLVSLQDMQVSLEQHQRACKTSQNESTRLQSSIIKMEDSFQKERQKLMVELGNISEENVKLQQRMMNMDSHYTQLQECNGIKNQEYSDLQKSLREMDMHYKEQLRKSNDECKSLKSKCFDLNQRMAAKISLDLQSSGVGFEDVSDPCNESSLRGMYDDMRLKDWPKLKRKFAITNERQRQQFYGNLIQTWKEIFDKANDCMEKSKQDLKKLFLQDQHQTNKEKVLLSLSLSLQCLAPWTNVSIV
ncbi:kinesin-like protein KIF15 isoform X2 [Engraulis encrasicolus]|uniref:kinesin-like protein KIF15 isoform X2 n=1 Tax=Engraulis encrasicolus TaxID=184585 RepID=UPI002FD5EAED